MGKPRIVKDYEKLPEEVREQIKLVYPKGFGHHLVTFSNAKGERQKGLPFETETHIYLIRMTLARAEEIVEEDEDYDDDGYLKERAMNRYSDKYEDIDYLGDLNANEDNEFEEDFE